MRSQSCYLNLRPNNRLTQLGFLGFPKPPFRISRISCYSSRQCFGIRANYDPKDSMGAFEVDGWDDESTNGYILLSSDSEDSDGEFLVYPITDVDMPSVNDRLLQHDEALTVTAHRLAMLGFGWKRNRSRYGGLNNTGLIIFLAILLLLVDWCAWRIVRLPLTPFYLTRPFCISAFLAYCTGYICIPFLNNLEAYKIQEELIRPFANKKIPTMGGIIFVPIGVTVAHVVVGLSSIEISAAAVVTLAFATIGLLGDIINQVKKHNNGLPAWMKILLQVAVAICFSFWLNTASISSPYGMKMLIPLPALGLVCIGNYYFFVTSLCFVSMGNVVDLTDGLDGLAAGTTALAFTGMAIAVLPICTELSIFGTSMAGACIGFLLHNRHKASVYMGETGSLALGGALAAMASCTGMFLPSFISSGIFVIEALSVIMQVSYFKTTEHFLGVGRPLLCGVPFHNHLKFKGVKEPVIVAGAYFVSYLFAVSAGYVGLISS